MPVALLMNISTVEQIWVIENDFRAVPMDHRSTPLRKCSSDFSSEYPMYGICFHLLPNKKPGPISFGPGHYSE